MKMRSRWGFQSMAPAAAINGTAQCSCMLGKPCSPPQLTHYSCNLLLSRPQTCCIVLCQAGEQGEPQRVPEVAVHNGIPGTHPLRQPSIPVGVQPRDLSRRQQQCQPAKALQLSTMLSRRGTACDSRNLLGRRVREVAPGTHPAGGGRPAVAELPARSRPRTPEGRIAVSAWPGSPSAPPLEQRQEALQRQRQRRMTVVCMYELCSADWCAVRGALHWNQYLKSLSCLALCRSRPGSHRTAAMVY